MGPGIYPFESGIYEGMYSKVPWKIMQYSGYGTAEQANLNFQQGILSLKGQLLTSEGEVKKAEAALNTANLAIENAKASKPGNIVQSLVNAKTAAKQAEVNLQAAQASYSELEEVFNFLVETQKELFS